MFSYAFGEATTGSGSNSVEEYSSCDDSSFEMKPGFEGPEKTLHVVFDGDGSLRSISEERWSMLLELACCKILSVIRSPAVDGCDAYVLSESSLFVYDRHAILKTCGTTKLLDALDDCLAIGASRGLVPRTVFYTRKNFTFPELQPAPYRSFADECAFLDERLGNARSTHSEIAGPPNADHWCFYLANFADEDESEALALFEVKMHEIDPQRAEFFVEHDGWNGKLATEASGISALLPGQAIDEHLFSPCGYSMNGICDKWFSTIHCTPESHCSYVSFETNAPLLPTAVPELLARVLSIFRPATFSVTLTGARCNAVARLCAEQGYTPCGEMSTVQLGAVLPLTMTSFIATDLVAHPLGDQAIRRLTHLARRAKEGNIATPVIDASPLASEAMGSITTSSNGDASDSFLLFHLEGVDVASPLPSEA